MNPTTHHELMEARIADPHRHAAAGRLACAGTRARRVRTHNGSPCAPVRTITVLARLVIIALGARSLQQEPQ